MSLSWDDITEDEWSKRFFLELNDESLVAGAITKVTDEIRQLDLDKKLILNVNFHVESSIIYIYPCERDDIETEVNVHFMIQLCFLFEAFEKIESKYYNDPKFYNIEHGKLVRQYLNYVYPQYSKAFSDKGLEIMYTDQVWSDVEGIEFVEVELPH